MSDGDELQALIALVPTLLKSQIQHFWGKRLTVGSYLYFSNRILAVITLLLHFQTSFRPSSADATAEVCKPLIYSILVLSAISNFVMQSVLVLRTYALWDCSKRVLWFLMGLNIVGSLAQQGLVATFWGRNVVSVPSNPLPAPYTSCLVVFNLGTWQRYVPILVFEFAVAVLLVTKFIDYVRQGRSHCVLYVLFRDGFVEFTAVSIVSILSLLIGVSKNGNSQLTHITFDLVSATSMVCCARLLLNIRDVMALSDPLDTTKPNPWSLSPSFDERYGRDPHVFTVVPDFSQMEMFETFFRSSEQAYSTPERVDATRPPISIASCSDERGDEKGKVVSRGPITNRQHRLQRISDESALESRDLAFIERVMHLSHQQGRG
ncbi:hypothetical protein DL93DRAFT_2170117 [Clavulina sp. PMI_390]|nr:hypothetical protein DL93DRAFT_2170117 [Clavulina sp. PMI_390]